MCGYFNHGYDAGADKTITKNTVVFDLQPKYWQCSFFYVEPDLHSDHS